jgi:hypothetical protein
MMSFYLQLYCFNDSPVTFCLAKIDCASAFPSLKILKCERGAAATALGLAALLGLKRVETLKPQSEPE